MLVAILHIAELLDAGHTELAPVPGKVLHDDAPHIARITALKVECGDLVGILVGSGGVGVDRADHKRIVVHAYRRRQW